MDSEFSIDLAGVPGHLSLGFGQGWNRRKLREVENGAESASCDFSARAIKEKSAQEDEGEGGLLRRRRREVCSGGWSVADCSLAVPPPPFAGFSPLSTVPYMWIVIFQRTV